MDGYPLTVFLLNPISLLNSLLDASNFICNLISLQWIPREISRLQKLIDRANEKGWRREYPFHGSISYKFLVLNHAVVN